jgi:hypothetical protein
MVAGIMYTIIYLEATKYLRIFIDLNITSDAGYDLAFSEMSVKLIFLSSILISHICNLIFIIGA